MRTVIIEPQMNVFIWLMLPSVGTSSAPNKSATIFDPSPATMQSGKRMIAHKRFEYQESRRALPSRMVKLCLITTEWIAVMAELATPKNIPTGESGLPSRKTPTTNPRVTMPHAKRMRSDGRECRITNEITTVNGRTMPRAI